MKSIQRINFTQVIPTVLFLVSMFFIGRAIGYAVYQADSRMTKVMEVESWGLGFGREGSQPTGSASAAELKKYDAYFVGGNSDKVIYLTFDCGYENGNTEPILDALKKHDVQATFFVVGHFLESAPDIVKRMVEEGHSVGNHTYHHPDMSAIAGKEAFRKEMDDVAELFRKVTGREIARYYRPPQGKYSNENLQMAQELGYSTFFWSLAYVDWIQDDQPTREEALDKLLKRVHPGAIVLLHSTSRTNGEIMDELLTRWKEMGYTFRPLSDLTGETNLPKVGSTGQILQEGNPTSGNSIVVNGVEENIMEENTKSENIAEENTELENVAEENTGSENVVEENATEEIVFGENTIEENASEGITPEENLDE